MNTYNEFIQYIDKQIITVQRRIAIAVFADWLEEQGNIEHIGWRWIVDKGFQPWITENIVWCNQSGVLDTPDKGTVDVEVWNALDAPICEKYRCCKEFKDRIELEQAVAKNYAKIHGVQCTLQKT